MTAMDALQDVRFSLRQLRKNPGFTATAVIMLALGLCASVAIFAFVDGVLIKPLPYQDPQRLIGVFERTSTFPYATLSFQDYQDWKRLNKTFSGFDIYRHDGFTWKNEKGSEPVNAARVSGGIFRTLGVTPMLGRDFAPDEDRPSSRPVALLSHAGWQKRFNGDPTVIGRTMTLDDRPVTIIGVLPASFHFAPVEPAEIFAAYSTLGFGDCEQQRSCRNVHGVARLKDGLSIQAARDDVASIAKALEQRYPDSNKDQGSAVRPLTEMIGGNLRPILFLLLSGAVLLLLIASVNVSSLLLVRAESRRREIAVRNALGASTGRLLSQFATEGLMLTAAGTALGLGAAYAAIQLLTTLIPATVLAQMPFLQDLGLNGRVLTFAGGLALLATLLFSLVPAVRLSRTDVRAGLAEGSRGSAGHAWRRLGSKLVIVELAMAMVLLVGAGLLGRSLYQLLHVDLGFRPDRLVWMEVSAPRANYGTVERQAQLLKEVAARVSTLPGVQSAAIAGSLPIGYNGSYTIWFRPIGKPWNGEHNDTAWREVSAGYFQTVGARLARGRWFAERDDRSTGKVVIVNQRFAAHYFPGEDAVGREIVTLDDGAPSMRIVGVVEDVREGPLDEPIPPVIYASIAQNPELYFFVVARVTRDDLAVLPAMASTITQMDPSISTMEAAKFNQHIERSMSAVLHRSSAWLVSGFAGVAFLLSLIGVYGVVAYSVSQRTREIGVRMALGAHRGLVYRLILREAGTLTLTGVVIGVICAIGAASLMRNLLFGVESWDGPTLLSVALVLAGAALFASFIPARRAASINPVEALRAGS
jgi:macrolide transport system ATP-binding/permease protein